MNIFKPCYNILPENQKQVFPQLAPCKDLGFALYGGTAVALQLGHRSSVDFDFFSHLPLGEKEVRNLLYALPFLKQAEILQEEENTRVYLTEKNVKVSFFGSINFGRVGEPCLTENKELVVASLLDLLATKLAVVMKRVERKDYQDIAELLCRGQELRQGLRAALALYGKQFSPVFALKTITWFEGENLQFLQERFKKILVDNVQKMKMEPLSPLQILAQDLTGC